MKGRIHHVSCSVISGPAGTDSFEKAERLARDIEKYARKRHFAVMYENADDAEPGDSESDGLR